MTKWRYKLNRARFNYWFTALCFVSAGVILGAFDAHKGIGSFALEVWRTGVAQVEPEERFRDKLAFWN